MSIKLTVFEGVSLPDFEKRGGHAGGLVGGKVVIAGGTDWNDEKTVKTWLNTCLMFDNGQWMRCPDLPEPVACPAYAFDHTGLYLSGGSNSASTVSRNVYRLRQTGNNMKWETLAPLPQPLDLAAGAILDGRFYVAGGTAGGVNSNSLLSLDLSVEDTKWAECQPFPGSPRILPALVACGKYLYLLGGLSETKPLIPMNDAYRYDPNTNQWSRLNDLPLKGYAWVAASIDNRRLLLTGRADGAVHDQIWIVDTKDMSVHEAGRLIVPATTAPLLKVDSHLFWMIGGEPDPDKNRTGKVSVIRINK